MLRKKENKINKVKEKNHKKQLPREIGSSLFTVIVIVVTLGVTLPFHFIFPDKLTTYWVIAISFAVITPFALVNLKINMEAMRNYTEDQKKAAAKRIGMYMLSIWYVDFTFVCMFMNWLVAFFILAGLYLIKMIYNVSSVLVNRKDVTKYPNFLIIVDFVLCFLLLILLIYKIPNETLQTIVISLTAALISGLLTLLGVIMTIKKSEKDKIDEEIKKAKPLVFISNFIGSDKAAEIKTVYSKNNKGTLITFDGDGRYSLSNIYITNSDFSYSALIGFRINEFIHIYDQGIVLSKNGKYRINSQFCFKCNEMIKYVALVLKDMLDNVYELEVNFELVKQGSTNYIRIISGIAIKETDSKFDFKEYI